LRKVLQVFAVITKCWTISCVGVSGIAFLFLDCANTRTLIITHMLRTTVSRPAYTSIVQTVFLNHREITTSSKSTEQRSYFFTSVSSFSAETDFLPLLPTVSTCDAQ